MKPRILVSHPFGNANVRHAALAFAQADALAGFRTCINWRPGSLLDRLLPESFVGQLRRRAFPAEVAAHTRVQPWSEAMRLLAMRGNFRSWIAHERGPFSVDAICRRLDAWVARELDRAQGSATAVYAYEDAAEATFAAAKRGGQHCFYDLPIGYWQAGRSIQGDEAERQPEWAGTLSAMIDSPAKLARKDAELAGADTVFVASQFTARTLRENGWAGKQIHIIPYGCPDPLREPPPEHTGPLRILFAGSLGQRKGTAYLLAAVEKLGYHVELTLLGSRPDGPCVPLDRALGKHRWIPSLPHDGVLAEMRAHDVLVFPSLFEGFGLVISEALSQGLPVITTPHTAGPDLLTEGQDGYIVPVCDANAIAEKLEILLQNRKHLRSMKQAALQKAGLFTWHKYRSTLLETVTAELK